MSCERGGDPSVCGAGASGYQANRAASLFVLALPLAYRVRASSVFSFRFGASPELLVTHATESAQGGFGSGGQRVPGHDVTSSGLRLALRPFFATELRYRGGGSVFVEVGYRLAGAQPLVTLDGSARGASLVLGWRHEL